MRFLPIVERELRVAARLPATYRRRWLTVLAMLCVSGYVWLDTRHGPPNQLGNSLFFANSGVLFAAALGCGFITADALSREKREGTIGLLFLTDLRGPDLVIGNLFFTSLRSVYGLLGAFPILSLPLLLGGVSLQDFVRMQLVIINTAFFTLSAGLFISSVSEHAGKAMVGTAGLILFLIFGLPLIEGVISIYIMKSFDGEDLLFYYGNPVSPFVLIAGGELADGVLALLRLHAPGGLADVRGRCDQLAAELEDPGPERPGRALE